MMTLKEKSKEKINKIVKETINHFIILAASLNTPKIEKEILNLCLELTQSFSEDKKFDYAISLDDEKLLLLLFNNYANKQPRFFSGLFHL